MLKRARPILFLAFLLLTACLDYTERIVIGRDGSTTIELRLRVAKTIQTLIQKNPAFKALAMMMDPDTLEKNLPEGVTLAAHRHLASPGRQVYVNELSIANVQELNLEGSSMFENQTFKIEELPDGSLRYRRTLDFTKALQDPELAGMIQENRMGIVGILKNSPFSFALVSPLKILSTNGVVDGDTAKWDYSLFDLLKEPVEQEVVLAAPTKLDMAIGAVRRLFRPNTFPIFAGVLLVAFFAITYRRSSSPSANA